MSGHEGPKSRASIGQPIIGIFRGPDASHATPRDLHSVHSVRLGMMSGPRRPLHGASVWTISKNCSCSNYGRMECLLLAPKEVPRSKGGRSRPQKRYTRAHQDCPGAGVPVWHRAEVSGERRAYGINASFTNGCFQQGECGPAGSGQSEAAPPTVAYQRRDS